MRYWNPLTKSKIMKLELYTSKGIPYADYFSTIEGLVSNKKTSGSVHSQELVEYTRLNLQRMKRWNQTFEPTQELSFLLKSINRPMVWLCLTEAWCGDAAQNTPIIAKLASLNPSIKLYFLFRDENLSLMDQYLTNGSRSIPKLIAFDSNTSEEVFVWGPRPSLLQDQVTEIKKRGADHAEISLLIHQWYAQNKAEAIQQELLGVFREII